MFGSIRGLQPSRHGRGRSSAQGVRRGRWLGCLLTAAAMAGGAVATTSASSSSAIQGADAPNGTLRVSLNSLDAQNPDPGLYNSGILYSAMTMVFEPLFVNDPTTGELLPWLASGWQLEEGDSSYVITLRDDVTFSDGSPLTADDAVFSISRYIGLIGDLEPPLGQARLHAAISGLEVIDDQQFRLSFNETGSATLLSDLAANPGAAPGFIVPKHVVESVGDAEFNANPIGTGPFTLVSNEPGLSMAFEANPNYWGEGPFVARVEFSAVSDVTTRMSQLSAGEADIIDAVAGPAVRELQSSGQLRLVESKMATNQWIAIGGQTNPASPLSHVEVRQALSYAIDREAVVEVLLAGLGQPAYIFSFPASIGFPTAATDSLARPYDPDAARSLLESAGFADGFDLELLAVPVGSEMANAIAQNWGELGINVTVNVVEQGELLADLQSDQRKQETRMVLMSTVGMPFRAEIAGTWGTHINGGNGYGQPFANPRVGELVVEQASVTDVDARNAVIEELLTLAFDEQVNMPVWYASAIFGVGPNVEAWDLPDGSTYVINLATVRLAG